MTRKLLLEKICFSDCTYDCVVYGSCDCDYCEVKLNELLDKYDKHVIEQYKANINLKDTIREIHDNVAKEMYCKGIDDFAEKLKRENRETIPTHSGYCSMSFEEVVDEIAEELKVGVKNE